MGSSTASQKKRPARSSRTASLAITAQCVVPAVFDYLFEFEAGAFAAGTGAAPFWLRRIEFGSGNCGAVSEPGCAWKPTSSLNPNRPAVKTAGKELRVVL